MKVRLLEEALISEDGPWEVPTGVTGERPFVDTKLPLGSAGKSKNGVTSAGGDSIGTDIL
jgi:hypothetical protein